MAQFWIGINTTLGLAQVNPVNERMRQRLDELGVYGKGYDAIYLYPGLQKVVQAAGRVIRTTSDQGVLHLMDERYGRAEVGRLLPGWWSREGWEPMVKHHPMNDCCQAEPPAEAFGWRLFTSRHSHDMSCRCQLSLQISSQDR